jgi:hypothetical protein
MIILTIFLFTIIIFLSYRVYLIENKLKNGDLPKVKKDDIIIKPLKLNPKFEDVDGSHDLVKNVFESIKNENWRVEMDEKSYWYPDKFIETKIINPDNNVMVTLNVRIEINHNLEFKKVAMGSITIHNGDINKSTILTKKVSYDIESNNENRKLIYETVWGFIYDKYAKEYNLKVRSYEEMIENTSKGLKTLNRLDRLKNILD